MIGDLQQLEVVITTPYENGDNTSTGGFPPTHAASEFMLVSYEMLHPCLLCFILFVLVQR